MTPLTAEGREAFAPLLAHWQVDAAREGIRRSFVFADFPQSFGFMTQVALLAEMADHPLSGRTSGTGWTFF